MKTDTLNDDNYCFGCGESNPLGLKLNFRYDEANDQVIADTVFPVHFQGWQNVLHGGIISTVLDEAMAKAIGWKGFKSVTAELTVRFKHPAYLDKTFSIRAKVNSVRNRVIEAEASVTDSDKQVIATGRGKFVIMT